MINGFVVWSFFCFCSPTYWVFFSTISYGAFWHLFVPSGSKHIMEKSHSAPLRGLWQSLSLIFLENPASKAVVSDSGLVVILSPC